MTPIAWHKNWHMCDFRVLHFLCAVVIWQVEAQPMWQVNECSWEKKMNYNCRSCDLYNSHTLGSWFSKGGLTSGSAIYCIIQNVARNGTRQNHPSLVWSKHTTIRTPVFCPMLVYISWEQNISKDRSIIGRFCDITTIYLSIHPSRYKHSKERQLLTLHVLFCVLLVWGEFHLHIWTLQELLVPFFLIVLLLKIHYAIWLL